MCREFPLSCHPNGVPCSTQPGSYLHCTLSCEESDTDGFSVDGILYRADRRPDRYPVRTPPTMPGPQHPTISTQPPRHASGVIVEIDYNR